MVELRKLFTFVKRYIPLKIGEVKVFIDNLPIAIGLIQFREKQKDLA